MTNEMPPESKEIKPETGTSDRDPISELTQALSDLQRETDLITQEENKRKEQLQEMVEEVISMSEGNKNLQQEIKEADPAKQYDFGSSRNAGQCNSTH